MNSNPGFLFFCFFPIVSILFYFSYFYFLAMLYGMQDLSSLTRDVTLCPLHWKRRVLTMDSQGSRQNHLSDSWGLLWHLHFFLAIHSKPPFKRQTLPSLVYMCLVDFMSSTFFYIKASQFLLKWAEWKQLERVMGWWDLLGLDNSGRGRPFRS